MLRHEVVWEPDDLPRLLATPGVDVVHGRRQSCKTAELIRYAYNCHGAECIIVCMNESSAHEAGRLFYLYVAEVYQVDAPPPPPRFVSSHGMWTKLSGHMLPIYVDEWNRIDQRVLQDILDSGRFKKAVTS